MAVGQPRCSRCDALLILQAPSVRISQPASLLVQLQLSSLPDELNALDTHGTIEGDFESFDDLPDHEPVRVTCSCRRPYHLDRCQRDAAYGFLPTPDGGLPLACKAFDEQQVAV